MAGSIASGSQRRKGRKVTWTDPEKKAVTKAIADTKKDVSEIRTSLLGGLGPGQVGLIPLVHTMITDNTNLKMEAGRAIRLAVVALVVAAFALGQSTVDLITFLIKLAG